MKYYQAALLFLLAGDALGFVPQRGARRSPSTELQVFRRAYNYGKNKLVGGFKINGNTPEPVNGAQEQFVAASGRLAQLEDQLRNMETEYGDRVEQIKER